MKTMHQSLIVPYFLAIASALSLADEEQKLPLPAKQNVKALFESIATFDENKDGKLNDTEKTELVNAIASKTLKLPHEPKTPFGMSPPAGLLAGKLADVYFKLAPYDMNTDGALDKAEHKRMRADIDRGKLLIPLPTAGSQNDAK